jgi:hypothetical protein
MINHSVKAFLKRIILHRLRDKSFRIDRVHNRLFTVVYYRDLSPGFVDYLHTTNQPIVFRLKNDMLVKAVIGFDTKIIIIIRYP